MTQLLNRVSDKTKKRRSRRRKLAVTRYVHHLAAGERIKKQRLAFVTKNEPDCVRPTPSDLLLGCIVEGVAAIEQKKMGTYQGNAYSTVLFRAMGDVFEVKHVPQTLYNTLPDDKLSIIQIRCTTNYGLGRSMDGQKGSSRLSELYLGLDSFRLLTAEEPARTAPKESKA